MIWGGGYDAGGWKNTIDYITVANLGNATDFGDLTEARNGCGAVNDKTRAIWAGGAHAPDHSSTNTMDYVTMASTGNAFDFGDFATAGTECSVSSSTRGIWTYNGGPADIMYSTISTLGNASDYGDLNSGAWTSGGGSSATRGIFAGGYIVDTIQYITMATTGNAVDFGDMTFLDGNGYSAGNSNGHGGLSG